MPMDLLNCGSCEELKIGVHAGALGLAVIMGAYNAAAWLSRREQHLAINAVLYAALTAWEQKHVAHHLAEIQRPRESRAEATVVAFVDAVKPATDLAACRDPSHESGAAAPPEAR